MANGLPGVGAPRLATLRNILKNPTGKVILPGGVAIDGAKARDPSNTGYVTTLQAGILLGKITSGGLYAPSVLGVTTAALTGEATTLKVSAAVAAELVRRIGGSGSLKLTGPPTAGGTVATVTVAYSAVEDDEITITATGTAFVSGSIVQPADGSEVIRGLLATPDGLKVVDEDANNVTVQCPELLLGGIVDTTMVVNYPADAALKAWVKAQLRAAGYAYVFGDDY